MIDIVKNLAGEQICPFCFERYRLKSTPFRCASPPERCAPEVDPVLAKEWKRSLKIGRVLPSSGRFVRETRCGTCRQRTTKRLCPTCHMQLPHTVGDFRNYIFAVIGAKDVGKSHYIAVLIERIRNHVGPGMDMLLSPLNEETISRYREDFYNKIFRKRELIRGTVSALADQTVQLPLVYSLTFSGKNLWGKRTILNAVTLVFFDTAGEDLNHRDRMSVVNKYIYRSDGIILLLDPLQLDRVRDQLDESTHLPEQYAETQDIITRTSRLIRFGRGLKDNKMIQTPIAVAFSKLDAVEPLLDPQSQILSTSQPGVGFDVEDFEAVSSEMQSYLASWDQQGIIQQVRTNYTNHGFFGLSALGSNPTGPTKIPRVIPHRVEDPFLWLLHHHRLIKAVKR